MFGKPFFTYLRNAIPEFTNLGIEIGGSRVCLSDYDYIHALIANNNIVNGTGENIAVFHPADDLSDVTFLVVAGLASYKDSVLKNSSLKPDDLKPGDFIEYEGKIARYMGHAIDPADGVDKFELSYDDKYKTRGTMPIDPYFKGVTRYSGDRVVTEKSYSKTKKADERKKTIGALLNIGEQPVNLADYSSFLVCSSRPYLTDLLHETRVNGAPFFKIFPSAKCTSSSIGRITRDLKKHRTIFYFVPNLSVADDILRRQKSITMLIIDGRKVANSGSLLASIKADYGLEDIYLFEDSSRIASASDLSRNFGFKIWAWTPPDFRDFQFSRLDTKPIRRKTGEPDEFKEFLKGLVGGQNHFLEKLSRHREKLVEVGYPGTFNGALHNDLVESLSGLRNFNKLRNDASISAFLFSASAVANRIFQSPVFTPDEQVKSRVAALDNDAAIISGNLPDNLRASPGKIVRILQDALTAFSEGGLKIDTLAGVLADNSRRTCILVKRPDMIEPLRSSLAGKISQFQDPLELPIASITRNIESSFKTLIWTFRPDWHQYASMAFKAEESVFLLYKAQEKELAGVEKFYEYFLSQYASVASRAAILGVDVALLDGNAQIKTSGVGAIEPPDLEELLFTSSSFASVYGGRYGGKETMPAKQVLFDGGFMAFFSKGHRISVLDAENEGIEVKSIGTLEVGNQVVFLKGERRSIFEDVIGYYGHKPEVVEVIKTAAAWHRALANFTSENNLTPEKLMAMLKERGLDRGIATIENWLAGETICPFEEEAIDIISQVTQDKFLVENREKVKSAGRFVHGLHIKIGRYLARRVTQSVASPDSTIDDPVLKGKLNEASSYAEIAEVVAVGNEDLEINTSLVNRLLAPEDL